MKIITHHILRLLLTALVLLVSAGSRAADDFVVVIDAGHGGKDVGAMDCNIKEKDVNLGTALKLGETLKKELKGVKVIFTRDKDEYLTLQQRADIANKAKANIFVSIHTNSAATENPNRASAAGCSTHVLGPNKDANNMAVAQRENSVIKLEKDYEQKYQGFDPDSDESYIIFEMMQKKNLSRSIDLAKEIQQEMTTTAGRRDRGVHQNGFWVLWATSMPAVLVELDFICNPNSAKYIASKEGQAQMAEAICNAIKAYHNKQQHAALEETADEEIFIAQEVEQANINQGADGPTVVTAPTERVVSKAPEIKSSSNNIPTKRRRRSDASKAKSEKRIVETENIVVKTERQAETPDVEEAPVNHEEKAAAKNNSKNSKNSKKENSKNSKKENSKKEKNSKEKNKKENNKKADNSKENNNKVADKQNNKATDKQNNRVTDKQTAEKNNKNTDSNKKVAEKSRKESKMNKAVKINREQSADKKTAEKVTEKKTEKKTDKVTDKKENKKAEKVADKKDDKKNDKTTEKVADKKDGKKARLNRK